ncbi:MAG: enoyl-CoA hydratase [Pseudomonadota bacterium]|nr:enoyl-CoA hydratase [Pseudomonadota bacterium]MEC7361912.1 enoyl-CoA hydratase [Pseudomonadota bacterium]MEC7651715.1 enoyl-CoA hydratase [Pseudomonadota bacterium]MEC8244862.1 enoyl-CoA hydratase [Pseudomonadota bacterium]MEC8538609.1 enoyl-CoA hydratase [Pseudomonadota bacterium]
MSDGNLAVQAAAEDLVLADRGEDGVLRLTLNAPRSRNALSESMMTALSSALQEAAQDAAVRVIVIAANGPVFCAGHNLKEITAARSAPENAADRGRAYFTRILNQCSALMASIPAHPKPVIAEVAGTATAAGCQLVASCDLAFAAESAGFATPGVHIGLFCSTPMVALSRNVARKHAMEMLLTGDPCPAPRAAEIGLINRAVPDEDLTAEVMEAARKIAGKSTATVAFGKPAFYRQAELPLGEAYDYAAAVMVENMLARDAEEGISAFIEKRPPRWTDS